MEIVTVLDDSGGWLWATEMVSQILIHIRILIKNALKLMGIFLLNSACLDESQISRGEKFS